MKRRDLLKASTCFLAGVALLRDDAWAADALASADSAARFDYAALKGEARALATRPYATPAKPIPESVAHLKWDQFQAIRFRPDTRIVGRRDEPLSHRVLSSRHAVPPRGAHARDRRRRRARDRLRSGRCSIFRAAVWTHRRCRAILVSPDSASRSRPISAATSPRSSARAISARSAARCSTAFPRADSPSIADLRGPKNFPDFTAFWFERPGPTRRRSSSTRCSIRRASPARIDSRSRRASRWSMRVDAALYPRRSIERLGIAPLTSMFLCGPNDRRVDTDWRPSIHDSDGLAIWNGADECIWRPLVNPPAVRVNTFADDRPHGYGLLQRDRNFDHYQDDGVWYDRRPSLWVEPLDGLEQRQRRSARDSDRAREFRQHRRVLESRRAR